MQASRFPSRRSRTAPGFQKPTAIGAANASESAETTPLIGIFGFLKPYKRIAECLRAMQRLVRLNPRVKMILAGEEHPDFPVRRLISQLDLGKYVRVMGHVPIEEFEQLIGAADICLNLRYPTAGETSGTLLRALGLGRAVVVSDVGAFSDLPDEICMKVPVGPGETDLIFQYLDLLVARPEVARSMGRRARDYVAHKCSWPKVAELYARSVEAVAKGTFDTNWGLPHGESANGRAAPPESLTDSPDSGAGARASVEAAGWGGGPEAKPAPDQPQEKSRSPEQAWRSELGGYLTGLQGEPSAQSYLEMHLTRLVHTLEITPRGSPGDSVLEMGAYMQITPALKHKARLWQRPRMLPGRAGQDRAPQRHNGGRRGLRVRPGSVQCRERHLPLPGRVVCHGALL